MKQSKILKGAIILGLVSTLAVAGANYSDVNDNNDKDIQINSSLQLNDNSSEMDEINAAKIGVSEVVKVLKSEVPGKIIEVKLENEDGNLVYEAEVLTDKASIMEVFVDAGNGEILASKADNIDGEEDENDEAWYEIR